MTTTRDLISAKIQPVVSYSIAVTATLLHLIATKYDKTFCDLEYATPPQKTYGDSFFTLLKVLKPKTWKKVLHGKTTLKLEQLSRMLNILNTPEALFFELVDSVEFHLFSANVPVIPTLLKKTTLLDEYRLSSKALKWCLKDNFDEDMDTYLDRSVGGRAPAIILTPLDVKTTFSILAEGNVAKSFLDDEQEDEDYDTEYCNDPTCYYCKPNEDSDSEDDDHDSDDDLDFDSQDNDVDESSKKLNLNTQVQNFDQLRTWIQRMSEKAGMTFKHQGDQTEEFKAKSDDALKDLLEIFAPERSEEEEQELDKQESRDSFGFRVSELQRVAKAIQENIDREFEVSEEIEDETSSIYEVEPNTTAFDFLKSNDWFKTFADSYLAEQGASAEDLAQQKFMEEYSARLIDTFFKKPKI
jgi:hypothetical protein